MNVRTRGIAAIALVMFIGSSLWAHTERVRTWVDAAHQVPVLPGLRWQETDISNWQGQVIYLNLNSEQNVVYNGPVTIGPFDVPAFRAPGELAGSEAEIMGAVTAGLNDLFAVPRAERTNPLLVLLHLRPAAHAQLTIRLIPHGL